MKLKKLLFDVVFIALSAGSLLVLNRYGLLDKYVGYALIPILIAYYLGKYSNRVFSVKV